MWDPRHVFRDPGRKTAQDCTARPGTAFADIFSMAFVWGGTTSESTGKPAVLEDQHLAWRSFLLAVIALVCASLLAFGASLRL
jgi:hypothetical protein